MKRIQYSGHEYPLATTPGGSMKLIKPESSPLSAHHRLSLISVAVSFGNESFIYPRVSLEGEIIGDKQVISYQYA